MHRLKVPFTVLIVVFSLVCQVAAPAQTPRETFAPGHLVVVYRNGVIPADAQSLADAAGARSTRHIARLGVSVVHLGSSDPAAERATMARLLAHPAVAAVLHDRVVRAHAMLPLRFIPLPLPVLPAPTPHLPIVFFPAEGAAPDTLYNSPQSWAVLASGGYGDGVPGGATVGPWNMSRGAGVRIAVLDSGVDQNHPDLVPNLGVNVSEVDPTALPSPCDDGSAQDQQGHGTFAASLAAASIGGGETIGVAPQATLLNIKVLERIPAATGSTLTAQCEAGEADGLLSWVLAGLADAIDHHANVVSLSLGSLVDTATGDGAGWQAQFNAVTYAAQQAGIVMVAALGNDGLDLSTGTLVELPAQARGVLPVVASTNPACAENLAANATCVPGPVTRASYSNFGVSGAVAAPGGNYPQGSTTAGVSGFVRGACTSGLTNTTDGLPANGQSFGCFGLGHTQYVQAIGTSAAAPLVAGAAALVLGAHPNWTAVQIVQALRSSATQLNTLAEPALNLPAALALPLP